MNFFPKGQSFDQNPNDGGILNVKGAIVNFKIHQNFGLFFKMGKVLIKIQMMGASLTLRVP